MTNSEEILLEDLEAYHLAMDALGVPRSREDRILSEYGRALELARMAKRGDWEDD